MKSSEVIASVPVSSAFIDNLCPSVVDWLNRMGALDRVGRMGALQAGQALTFSIFTYLVWQTCADGAGVKKPDVSIVLAWC